MDPDLGILHPIMKSKGRTANAVNDAGRHTVVADHHSGGVHEVSIPHLCPSQEAVRAQDGHDLPLNL